MHLNINTNPYAISKQYGKWFDDLTDDFIETHRNQKIDTNEFKRTHGYFITISFNQNREHQVETRSEMDVFSDIYNWISRKVVGRNYHRPCNKCKLPLSIACIDANGTRHWKSKGSYENLHIHSMWVFTPDTISTFNQMISDNNWFEPVKERFGLRDINIQPLNDEKSSSTGVSRISSYTSKMIGWNSAELAIADDFRVFPIHRTSIH